jgi:DNA-binding MarR family transcriptional regulator
MSYTQYPMPALHSSHRTGGSDLNGQLAEGFTRVSAHLRRNSARHLAPLGLTYAQARLLRTIAGASRPLRMSELAAGLGIVPRSATTTVEALETAGFVVRLPDPDDRRSVLVALTPEARRAVTRIQSARCDAADEVFAALDASERATLLAFLDRVDALRTEATPR